MVNIPRTNTPIVILFGPPACGKTMTLVRLCRYLINQGYTVQPSVCYRDDEKYKWFFDNFNNFIFDDKVKPASTGLDHILIEVRDQKGVLHCYLYDAPGCWFFQYANAPTTSFPIPLRDVFASPNPKRWCFFTEPNYGDLLTRESYLFTIQVVYHSYRNPRLDKAIVIFNKIDKTPFLIGRENVRVNEAQSFVRTQYPFLWDIFINHTGVLSHLGFKIYDLRFVPFMTGYYIMGDRKEFIIGPDVFPANLWNVIQ